MRRKLTALFTLMFAFVMITANAGLAEASTSRVAIISKLEGTVEVQKSGGKKTLKGFRNMSLNEGDIVSTGSKSSVELKFSNGTSTDDTLVLESNTTVTFSKLSNRNGTVTKVKMKSGKAWVDVKSIASSSDDFQLETPTAIMGVRGTNFFIGIDPNTGQSVLSMFAGIVQLQNRDSNDTQPQRIYPGQISYHNPSEGELIGPISNESLEQLLQQTSPDTMQAILDNLKKIQDENNELLEALRNNSGSAGIPQDVLNDETLQNNIARLTAALLKAALDKGLISESDRDKKLEELFNNGASVPDSKLGSPDPNNEYDFILNQKSQEMLELLNKQNLVEAKKQELQKQMEEQKRKLEEEKQKREQQALDKYLDSLNERQKDQFLQERDRVERENTRPTPTPAPQTPAPRPTPTPTPQPSWDDVAEPFALSYYDGEELQLAYSKVNNSQFSLNEPLTLPYQGESYLRIEAAGNDMTVTSVTMADQELYGDEGIYNVYSWQLAENGDEFTLTIGMNHTSYGNKLLTLTGSLQYEEPIEEPIVDAVAPEILEPPVGQVIEVGNPASLSVTASVNDGGTLSYQWYSNTTDSNEGGTAIQQQAEGTTYNVPTGTPGTYYYYVIVTNTNTNEWVNGVQTASTTSDVVQVIVNPIVNAETPSIANQPVSQEINVGDSAPISVMASVNDGGTLSYQWYSNTTDSNEGGTAIQQQAEGATYDVPTGMPGTYYYYVIVTNTNEWVNGVQTASTTSDVVRVKVTDPSGWNDVQQPFVVKHERVGEETQLHYYADQGEIDSYAIGEIVMFSQQEMLVIEPFDSSFTITEVLINGEDEMEGQNGIYRAPMPEGEFELTISMTHDLYGSKTFTLRGYSYFSQQQPGWEDLDRPFELGLVRGMVTSALQLQSTENAFSYEVNGRINVFEGDKLAISAVDEFKIVGVSVNDEPVLHYGEGEFNSFSWPLEAMWSTLNIEIKVRHSDLGEQSYWVTVMTKASQGWQSIGNPFNLTLATGQSQQGMPISYTHDDFDYFSLALDHLIVLQEPSEFRLSKVSGDYTITAVTAYESEYPFIEWYPAELYQDDAIYSLFLNPEQKNYRFVLEVEHSTFGEETFELTFNVAPDNVMWPALFSTGNDEMELNDYWLQNYDSNVDYGGLYERILDLGYLSPYSQGGTNHLYVKHTIDPIIRLEYESEGEWIEIAPHSQFDSDYLIELPMQGQVSYRMTIKDTLTQEDRVYLIIGEIYSGA